MSEKNQKHELRSQHTWLTQELDPSDAQYVRERLDTVPYLTPAFRELADGLEMDSSRTVYRLPINYAKSDVLGAMVGTARGVAEVIHNEDLEGIELGHVPFVVHENDSPEEFGESNFPEGIKAHLDPEAPIGYLRMVKTEIGLQASVGCLDPETQTHYSLPL